MRLNKRGQFIPITAMVMFTTVVFMVAVLNIYKVTRAKLKVQNLADAAALNIASQMASSMNKVTDLNEWMNHFLDQAPTATPSKAGDLPNCVGIDPDLPPLACAENSQKNKNLNMFSSLQNAQAYAGLVQRINQAQDMFANTYNNFIGAGQASNASAMANSSLQSILLGDIPELADQDTHVVVWNSLNGQAQATRKRATLTTANNASSAPHSLDTSGMSGLQFKTHDVVVGYWSDRVFLGITTHKTDTHFRTLGDVLYGQEGKNTVIPDSEKIGWKELDTGPNAPTISVDPVQNKVRFGAGAMVVRYVQVPVIGRVSVVGKAQAYVVEGSGAMGAQTDMIADPFTGVQRPVFKPTYWVKLAGAQ